MMRSSREVAFGVGMAKTGTHMLASLLQDSLRSVHEPQAEALMRLVLHRYCGSLAQVQFAQFVQQLVERANADFNVSQLNGFIIDTLLALFPHSRFVLTLRDCTSWLRSFVNHQRVRKLAQDTAWIAFRELRFRPADYPHSEAEQALTNHGFYSIDAYLSYWERHNAAVIRAVPAEQLLIVPTPELSNGLARIAAFLDVTAKPAAFVDEFRADYIESPLDDVDANYLQQRLDFHTAQLLNRVGSRIPESVAFYLKHGHQARPTN